MRQRLMVTTATAAAFALAGLAGCGGSSDTVTQTVTTDTVPTTAPTTTAPPVISAPTTEPAPSGSIGEDRLPPAGALAGTSAGTARELDSPEEFVDTLYQTGDPSKPAAAERLDAAGYVDGILRDELGSDPASGIALFRTYAILVRDDASAQTEVDDAADEVESASSAPSTDVSVSDIPGARALRLDINQAGTTGSVVFVTFAVGPYIYGLQGVATSSGGLPQDELVAVARTLYARVSATP